MSLKQTQNSYPGSSVVVLNAWETAFDLPLDYHKVEVSQAELVSVMEQADKLADPRITDGRQKQPHGFVGKILQYLTSYEGTNDDVTAVFKNPETQAGRFQVEIGQTGMDDIAIKMIRIGEILPLNDGNFDIKQLIITKSNNAGKLEPLKAEAIKYVAVEQDGRMQPLVDEIAVAKANLAANSLELKKRFVGWLAAKDTSIAQRPKVQKILEQETTINNGVTSTLQPNELSDFIANFMTLDDSMLMRPRQHLHASTLYDNPIEFTTTK